MEGFWVEGLKYSFVKIKGVKKFNFNFEGPKQTYPKTEGVETYFSLFY